MRGAASWPALGCTATVCVTEPLALDAAERVVRAEVEALDLACSRFRPDSELTALNRSAGKPFAASPLLFDALRVALGAAAATGGIVDPTVGAALRAAGYDRDFGRVRVRKGFRPSFAVVPGWRTVALDERRREVIVAAGVELDLGATAKALGADRAAAAASAAAGCGVLVSLGGDVSVAGPPPPGGWTVALADSHLADPAAVGPRVAIAGGGLASSSTAVRRWTGAGARLHHLIDPRTGEPARTPWRTVSVAAASAVDANTASTAAVVLGAEAPAWLERHRLPARLVREDGRVTTAGGWPGEAP